MILQLLVKMLDIIKDRLEDEHRPYSYLTGQTQDRGKVIEEFQTTEDPSVFYCHSRLVEVV